jgi:hypothetical protein
MWWRCMHCNVMTTSLYVYRHCNASAQLQAVKRVSNDDTLQWEAEEASVDKAIGHDPLQCRLQAGKWAIDGDALQCEGSNTGVDKAVGRSVDTVQLLHLATFCVCCDY